MSASKSALVILSVAFSWLAGCKTTVGPPEVERVRYEPAPWSSVAGWHGDEVQEAWSAFLQSCSILAPRDDWRDVCNQAIGASVTTTRDARYFFETRFVAYRLVIERGRRHRTDTGLITGYYEPLLRGARTPSDEFTVPLYAPPDDLLTIDLGDLHPELKGRRVRGRLQGKKVVPYPSRAELKSSPSLKGKELVWVDSAVDAFFLEVQGSGRVQLSSGETIRLTYGDQNGHPYRAIGRYLVDLGELSLDQVSAQSIRAWLAAHPERAQEVFESNPSAVFFRAEPIADPSQGPRGALNVPLTAGRSIAVDPKFIPLGAPVFMSTTQPASDIPLQRLVLAQDTGGAIRGAIRADLFWGFGAEAGEQTGRTHQQSALWLLLPKGMAAPLSRSP